MKLATLSLILTQANFLDSILWLHFQTEWISTLPLPQLSLKLNFGNVVKSNFQVASYYTLCISTGVLKNTQKGKTPE